MFYVLVDFLLGFIVSQKWITMDPFKFQAILNLPPLRTLHQLQSLQGKANFLHHFILDYATKVHGLLRLLHTNVPFMWHEQAQAAFDALQKDMTFSPLLSPPYFTKDFIPYVLTSENAIARVLAQEDDAPQEHVIYYVS